MNDTTIATAVAEADATMARIQAEVRAAA